MQLKVLTMVWICIFALTSTTAHFWRLFFFLVYYVRILTDKLKSDGCQDLKKKKERNSLGDTQLYVQLYLENGIFLKFFLKSYYPNLKENHGGKVFAV